MSGQDRLGKERLFQIKSGQAYGRVSHDMSSQIRSKSCQVGTGHVSSVHVQVKSDQNMSCQVISGKVRSGQVKSCSGHV